VDLKPRELTWVTGVVLAVVTVSFGVTGYSLPWDQVGFWACKIVTGVPAAVPIVGPPLVLILRGGECWSKYVNKILQCSYFCFTISCCSINVNSLLNDP
jgi:quinol-cytochrome oxidoreductase complex cytochrome b subunit